MVSAVFVVVFIFFLVLISKDRLMEELLMGV